MDFDFSDDQEQLRDAVRKWVDKAYSFDRRREIVAAGGFSREAYTELAELGLAGLYIAEEDGGMGMGLAICRSIVEAHHGRIVVGHDPDLGGARFTIGLPLALDHAPVGDP